MVALVTGESERVRLTARLERVPPASLTRPSAPTADIQACTGPNAARQGPSMAASGTLRSQTHHMADAPSRYRSAAACEGDPAGKLSTKVYSAKAPLHFARASAWSLTAADSASRSSSFATEPKSSPNSSALSGFVLLVMPWSDSPMARQVRKAARCLSSWGIWLSVAASAVTPALVSPSHMVLAQTSTGSARASFNRICATSVCSRGESEVATARAESPLAAPYGPRRSSRNTESGESPVDASPATICRPSGEASTALSAL